MSQRTFLFGGLFALLTSACGGAEVEYEGEAGSATSGAEAEAALDPDPAPDGPIRSYIAAAHVIVLRLDMERVRASAVGDDIGALVRGYPTWQELLGRSGLDPVADFDRVLVASPSGGGAGAVLVIRHHLPEARVRQAVLDMSVESGTAAPWREVAGFDVVDWPAATEVPRVVVLTDEGELVVTSADVLPEVIAVARDHRARRTAGLEALEPGLALEAGTIAQVSASEVSSGWSRMFQYPPQSFELVVTDDAEEQGRVRLAARAMYPDAAAAEQARALLAQQRDQYAGHMMVRAVGLDRPLREAEIAVDGEQLGVRASFTEEELERVLGLMALLQLSGG